MACAGFWIRVTTITEEMDVDMRNADFFCDFQEGDQVIDMRVLP